MERGKERHNLGLTKKGQDGRTFFSKPECPCMSLADESLWGSLKGLYFRVTAFVQIKKTTRVPRMRPKVLEIY